MKKPLMLSQRLFYCSISSVYFVYRCSIVYLVRTSNTCLISYFIMKRKPRKAIVVVIFLGLITAGIMLTPFGCSVIGGRWGSTCVSPLCDYFGDCGQWIGPMINCDTLPLQTSKARVYFLFGQPWRVSGNTEYWAFGKVPVFPKITYSDARVSHVACLKTSELSVE